MRVLAALILMLMALPGCKGRHDRDGPGPKGSPRSGDLAAEQEVVAMSPEIARWGEDRPCFLCEGHGVCSLCRGEGRFRADTCPACDGSRQCPDCKGDGRIERMKGDRGEAEDLPGQCPLCHEGSGFCAECGGAGALPDGRECPLCGGERWCIECRGTGVSPWYQGRDIGLPEGGCPPFHLRLVSGESYLVRLLDPPSGTVSIERREGSRTVRESILARDVVRYDYIRAKRRFLDPSKAAEHLDVAAHVLSHAQPLHFFAAYHIAEARRLSPRLPQVETATLALREVRRTRWAGQARAALGEGDLRRAWVLAQLLAHNEAGNRGSSEKQKPIRPLLTEIEALRTAANAGLSAEQRDRRSRAERGRMLRTLRRASGYRARAEEILAREDLSAADLERARRAALTAWIDSGRAAARAPAEVDVALAIAERRAALEVRVLVIAAFARRHLAVGQFQRARSIAVIALSLSPESDTARRVNAVVNEAGARLAARRALEEVDK